MYARVSTSPERASCITHGTSPRSSKRTFAASLAVCTTIGRLYESPAPAPDGAGSAQCRSAVLSRRPLHPRPRRSRGRFPNSSPRPRGSPPAAAPQRRSAGSRSGSCSSDRLEPHGQPFLLDRHRLLLTLRMALLLVGPLPTVTIVVHFAPLVVCLDLRQCARPTGERNVKTEISAKNRCLHRENRSYSIPSRSSRPSSRRQRFRTRTWRSRKTRPPSSRSSSARAAVPISLILRAARADQDPLLGLGLGPDVGMHLDHPVLAVGDLGDLDLDGVGQLVAGATQDLLADQLGEQDLARQVRALLRREQERALRAGAPPAWRSAGRGPCPLRALTGKISSTPSSSAVSASTPRSRRC